jgi:hypothetical protein
VERVDDEPTGRLPLLAPEAPTGEQREVYDAVAVGPRAAGSSFGIMDKAGRLLGPYNAMLHSPAVGMPLQELGAAVRFRSGFSPREREIAILLVAKRWRSDFVWYAHKDRVADAGLPRRCSVGRAARALGLTPWPRTGQSSRSRTWPAPAASPSDSNVSSARSQWALASARLPSAPPA